MKLIYLLHSFIRRNLSLAERLLTTLGVTALLYGLLLALPAYPLYWDGAILVATFLLMLWSPVAGYFFAVVVALYPIYTISIYLAVLFLAIAIIGQHIFIQDLGATLLTLATPLLGAIYLPWVVPLLGGLWWGPTGGLVMGAFGALWGLLVAGWVGLTPDWMSLWGILPAIEYLPQRFANANSLETLLRLVMPLAPSATGLLYTLLQAAAWGLVGWAVGMLNQKEWVQYRRPRIGMLMAGLGALSLTGLHAGLSYWLEIPVSLDKWEFLWLTMLFSTLAVVILEFFQDFLEHPLPIPEAKVAIHFEREHLMPESQPSAQTIHSVKSDDNNPKDDSKDLIMLELD